MFKDFFQGLTTELVEAARSIKNSLRSESYLKKIIPLVSRDDGQFEAWIQDMEKYFSIVEAREEDKCRAALVTTDGHVGTFVHKIIRDNENISWTDLTYMLRDYYGITSNPHESFLKLANVRQGRNEGIQDYMQRVFKLADRAYNGRDKGDPIIRDQVKTFFTEGLRDTGVKLAVLRSEPPTVESAYQKALSEDRWRIRINTPSNIDHEPMEVCHARRRTVRNDAPIGGNRQVDRPRGTGAPMLERGSNHPTGYDRYGGPECWHCRRRGHTWRQCQWRTPNSGNGPAPFAMSRAYGNAQYRRM